MLKNGRCLLDSVMNCGITELLRTTNFQSGIKILGLNSHTFHHLLSIVAVWQQHFIALNKHRFLGYVTIVLMRRLIVVPLVHGLNLCLINLCNNILDNILNTLTLSLTTKRINVKGLKLKFLNRLGVAQKLCVIYSF